MIKIFDNLISSKLQLEIHKEVLSLKYYSEKDFPNDEISVGFSSDIDKNGFIYRCFSNIFLNIPEIQNKYLHRLYVNKFLPKEIPVFHVDYNTEDSYTVLYYSSDKKFNLNQFGETQFYLSEVDEVKGILAKPGRIVIFNSNILHRATSFKDYDRYTIAFKFK